MKKDTLRETIPKKKLEIGEYLSTEEMPAMCARFGCGRKLSLMESLFGKYCVNHASDNPTALLHDHVSLMGKMVKNQ